MDVTWGAVFGSRFAPHSRVASGFGRHPKFRLQRLAKVIQFRGFQTSRSIETIDITLLTSSTMAPQRLGGSRRSYNPITGAYNAFFVSENAPIVRSVTAFGVSSAPSLSPRCFS